MGEPMLNFLEVSNAIEEIHSKHSFDYKKITLSTSGIHLNKLVFVSYNIAISLHSANDSIRKKLMPSACSVKEIIDFVKEFPGKNGVMIEYSLISGVNDREEDLKELLSLDWPKNTNFNLIEFNDIKDMKKSSNYLIFKEAIRNAGYKCFIRESRGLDIEAACGMLNYE
jgi:23S rRNA (adenine2503-C2)-methyltransferase